MSDELKPMKAIDKSKWGDGPWQTEVDDDKWEYSGMNCRIRRGPLGALCGYVGVPASHPWFGKDYSDDGVDAYVHGGLTFAEKIKDDTEGLWWFGFDCAHQGDLVPAMNEFSLGHRANDIYRGIWFVHNETNALAEQIAAVAS